MCVYKLVPRPPTFKTGSTPLSFTDHIAEGNCLFMCKIKTRITKESTLLSQIDAPLSEAM